MTDVDKAVVLLTLSDYNDRWNKIALGISDDDVPSRPANTRTGDDRSSRNDKTDLPPTEQASRQQR